MAEATQGKGISRRNFLRGATFLGLGAVVGAPLITGCADGTTTAPGTAPAEATSVAAPASADAAPGAVEAAAQAYTYDVFTVEQFLGGVEGNDEATEAQRQAMTQSIRTIEQQLYGQSTEQPNNWVVRVTKPKGDTSVVVNLQGVIDLGLGKGKKGAQKPGIHVEFQSRADTLETAIDTSDPFHNETDLVHRVAGSNTLFLPYFPGNEFNQLQPSWNGWAHVNLEGANRPVMTILGETPEDMLLYVPATQLEAAGYSPDVVKFGLYLADLSYPAADPE